MCIIPEHRMYVSEVQQGPRKSGNPVGIRFNNLDRAKTAQFIHSDSVTPQSHHKLLVFDHGECKLTQAQYYSA